MAMLKPLNDAFGEYLWDLNEHDWQITDVIYPSKFEDNRAGLGPLKESWGPPGLGEDLRIAGDEQSWVIKLNTQGVHAPDEDYLIESQEFDFDDMPYGEPPRRDIDFYRVQMDVYEHPLLCHRYALCNEEWSEFLDRRLDRLFALKLAKTKRAARPKDIFQAATFVSADSTDGEYLKIDPQQFEWWRQVLALSYSAGTGQYLLTGSTDRTIRLFSPSSSKLIQTYSAHGYEVLDIAVADANDKFISVGGDKTVFVWDVATAQTLRRWSGHAGRVNACAWAGEGESVVVSGSYDSTVKLWDTKARSEKPLMTLAEAKDSVSTLHVQGPEILVGSVDGRVRCYDLRMGCVDVDVIGHSVTTVVGARAKDSYLVSTLDSTLRLMDKRDGKLLQAFRDPEFKNTNYRIRSTLAAADSLVISGSEDGSVFVWDLLSGTLKHRLRHSQGAITEGKPNWQEPMSSQATSWRIASEMQDGNEASDEQLKEQLKILLRVLHDMNVKVVQEFVDTSPAGEMTVKWLENLMPSVITVATLGASITFTVIVQQLPLRNIGALRC
ncbi:hypothetical protein H2203_001796 [Taxawa tesnikishii (nom. ined.)]|nr:hypothetical protein H2203_001796 [Dothideales sp. JES 119]